ncbi:MAG: T9SS type A sorting domain-containing protein, partial [Candidatus Cloacimonetes bacterium]|nr:T9SS type A sorting domain-containing protein [Candidatus Cloacimonadota bacterium]
YDAKRPAQLMNDFAIINPHNQNPEYVPLIARAGTPYYHIKFNKQKDDEITAPVIQLQQNYPNPFNPETNINFYLSKDDNIKLSIYNVKGQKVRDLYSGYKQAGKHTIVWDGKDSMNKSVSSGIYLYKLNTRYGSIQRKMTLIK